MNRFAIAGAVALVAFACTTAQAGAVAFDFEGASTGSTSSLTQTSAGVTVTIDLDDDLDFFVQDASAFGPATWGDRTLLGAHHADKFVANFSGTSIFQVAIEGGDVNSDQDDVYFEVWTGADGAGTKLYSDFVDYAFSDTIEGGADVIGFSYAGNVAIGSILFWNVGITNVQNLYWDNLTVNTATAAVPLPPAAFMGLGLLGGLGLLTRLRKRQSSSSV